MRLYVNGNFVDESEATVSVLDRGFLFGDGVYEVWRAVRGRLFEPSRHQARLERGLRELRIAQPADTRGGVLNDIAERLLADNDLTEAGATFYVEVTRGAAARSHAFPSPGTPVTVLAMVKPFAPDSKASEAGAAAITVPDIRWLRCDIKTVQLLPNVLANQQAKEAGVLEAIFVRDGRITEGTHTNIFGVLDGVLRTHPADEHVLPGVTRAIVLEMARESGIAVDERAITVDEIPALEELFLCGTTSDVTPLVALDGRIVGEGVPGPVTTALSRGLLARFDALAGVAAR